MQRHLLPVTDADGHDLHTGDRVKVTGSDRFGEGEGVLIGYLRRTDENKRIDADGELVGVDEQTVRLRVRLDNGTDGDDYTASQGRVAFIGVEEPLQAQ